MTHYVYRYFDAKNDLLYVGCSKNPWNRYRQHRSDSKQWIGEVTFGRLSVFADEAAARAAERAAIESEHPRYNRTFRTDRTKWTAEQYLRHAYGYIAASRADKKRAWNSEYMAQVREEYAALAGSVMPQPVIARKAAA